MSLCQQTLKEYNNATCTANNWMTNLMTNNLDGNITGFSWLLTPHQLLVSNAWYVTALGYVDAIGMTGSRNLGVVPVLSLTSELDIGPGTGTSSSPYQLAV